MKPTERWHEHKDCGKRSRFYSAEYDVYGCKACDVWMEDKCKDKQCEFCANRPEKPSDTVNKGER